MLCVGGKISFNQFKAILDESSLNSRITLQNANLMPRQPLLSLIKDSEEKNLHISLSGKGISAGDLIDIISMIRHPRTSMDIADIDNYRIGDIPAIAKAMGPRSFDISINSHGINHNTAPRLISVLAETPASLYLSSLTIMTAAAVETTLSAIGGRAFSLEIDAKASTPQRTVDTLRKVHSNTSINLTNADVFSTNYMPLIADAIDNKNCTVNLSATRFNLKQLKTFIHRFSNSVKIQIDSAHLYHPREIPEIMSLLGSRNISLNFNGRQLAVDPSDGDLLKKFIEHAKTKDTITINTMQYPPLSYILPIISSTAHTNLSLIYNGSQITDTEAHGNVVVRGIHAATPSTMITVNSVGVTNFRLENYLEIVRAAG